MSFLRIFFFALISLASVAPAHADETLIPMRDRVGHPWNRWVITEPRDHGSTLLLVVESPVGAAQETSVSERVVFRKWYASSELGALAQAVSLYSHPRRNGIAPATPAPPNAEPIWSATRSWTLDEEKSYATWVSTQVDTSLLEGSGVSVDCADFAITLRWIYAHDHALPAANTLSGSNALMGNWSSSPDWADLPTNASWRKDPRFKAALKYVLNATYTHTIVGDLYPIELSTDFVSPGSIILVLYSQDTGHTQVVSHIGDDAKYCADGPCIAVIWGNEPASETAYASSAWIRNLGDNGGGFLRWRWPAQDSKGRWRLTAPTAMPGYSLAQYAQPALSDVDFEIWAYAQVGLTLTAAQTAVLEGSSLLTQLFERQDITALGYLLCSLQPCRPDDSLYGSYSTPNADQHIRDTQAAFLKWMGQAPAGSSDLRKYLASLQKIPLGPFGTAADLMLDVKKIDAFSADPTRSIFDRWGVEDPDAKTSIDILFWAFYTGWLNRVKLVTQAFEWCYPNGAQTPRCPTSDSEYAALSTDRLDQSLRILAKMIQEQYPSLMTGDRAAFTATLRGDPATREPFCTSAAGAPVVCTAYDYLLAGKPMLADMTSRPDDTVAHRMGFK